MKHSTKRMLSLFMSAVFIISALVVFSNFIKPVYGVIVNKRAEIASREKVLADTQGIMEQVKTILSQYKNLDQFQQDISLSLPQDPSLAGALYQISNLASNNGLSIESINVSESSITPAKEENNLLKGTGTLKFSLKAAGNYESLKNFLDKIETNIRIFDLNTLKIDRVSEKTSNVFNFSIGVDTYYINEN